MKIVIGSWTSPSGRIQSSYRNGFGEQKERPAINKPTGGGSHYPASDVNRSWANDLIWVNWRWPWEHGVTQKHCSCCAWSILEKTQQFIMASSDSVMWTNCDNCVIQLTWFSSGLSCPGRFDCKLEAWHSDALLTPAKLCLVDSRFTNSFSLGCSAVTMMTSRVEAGILHGRPYGGVVTLIKKGLRDITTTIHCEERFVIFLNFELCADQRVSRSMNLDTDHTTENW